MQTAHLAQASALGNPAAGASTAFPSAPCPGFGPHLLDDRACRAWLAQRLHPAGAACPDCRLPVPEAQRARWLSWGRLRCACGRWHRATSSTPLAGAKLPARQLALILALLALGVAPAEVAAVAQVSAETVREWRRRLAPEPRP